MPSHDQKREERGTDVTSDEAELAKMGYKQELKRDLSLMQVESGFTYLIL